MAMIHQASLRYQVLISLCVQPMLKSCQLHLLSVNGTLAYVLSCDCHVIVM